VNLRAEAEVTIQKEDISGDVVAMMQRTISEVSKPDESESC
jgi:hypothetical protein